MSTVNWSLQHKRDTAANWTSNNPTLLAGQLGIETDGLTTTPKFKIGDGSSTWTALPYFYGGSASAQDLNNVLSVGSTTSGHDMTITANDKIKFGTGNAVIFNDSNVIDPSHVIIASNANYTGHTHLVVKDGANEWHDESAGAFTSIMVGAVANNAIQLDDGNDKINIFSGANGLNLQNDTYLNSVTASRLLSTDSNKKIAPLTGTGIVTLTAGVIGYDTNTYLTTSSASGTYQPLASNLTSLSGLTYASTSFVKMTAAGTFALDTNTYLTTSAAALAYQPLDADLTSWAGVTRASGFDTFVATPSSANFASLLTDETGSGKVVFDTGATVSNLTLDRISLAGNISSTAWTTNGIGIKHTTRTITDTTSSGTVAAAYTNLLGGNTIAASNSTTFSDYYSTYISSPVQGTNVTFTRSWSLGLAGNLDIGGNIRIGGVTSTGVTGSGSLVFGTSPSFTTDITTPSIIVSGNISAASWTTNGIKYKGVTSVLTNTTSSGTVANTYTNVFGGNSIVSSSATTYTNYFASYFKAEVASTGSTITNNYAAGFDNKVIINSTTAGVGLTAGNAFCGIWASGNTYAAFHHTSITPATQYALLQDSGGITYLNSGGTTVVSVSGTAHITLTSNLITIKDTANFAFNATTGSKLGTATTQKIGFWNATPIVQPTTAYAAASFTANAGTAVNDASTFDGYTIKQVVAALRGMGLLA